MNKFVYQNKFEAICQKFNTIEKEKYLSIKSSYEFVLKIIWVEEKFSILLDNFYEFEKTVHAVYLLLFESDKDDKIQEIGQAGIRLLNRRLLNFLSSSKMYIDQLLHDTSDIAKQKEHIDLYSEIKKLTNLTYDNSLSYQLMEFIRNVIQHKFLIVRGLHYAKPYSKNIDGYKHVPIFVNAYIKDLKKDKKFNNKIKSLNELDQYQSDEINLVYHIREYIKGLSVIHDNFRKKIQEELNICNDSINNNLESLSGFNSELAEIALIEYDCNNAEKDGVLIDRNILLKFIKNNEKEVLKFDDYFLQKQAVPCKNQVKFNNAQCIDIHKNNA